MYANSISYKEKLENENLVTKVYDHAKTSFTNALHQEWLDDDSQIFATKKVQNFKLVFLDKHAFCLDEQLVASKYEKINVSADFPENLVTLMVARRKNYYGLVGKVFETKDL